MLVILLATTEFGSVMMTDIMLYLKINDLTEYSSHCVVGYNYDMSLNLPRLFYKRDDNNF